MGYERRLEGEGGNEWARLCWEEARKRGREGRGELNWEKERERFIMERGYRVEEVDGGVWGKTGEENL